MNNAALYQNSNAWQRYDAKQVLDEFSNVWKWRSDGRDSMLDVGCGSGDVTMDLVLPIMPKNFSSLVGYDLSLEMVKHARKNHIHPKVSFDKFDLSIDAEQQLLSGMEKFDHITSFYCLQWIQNQKTVVRNLYKLLKPGGDLLVIFLSQHPVFRFFKEQSQDNRWAEHMVDVDDFCSPYQNSKQPSKEFKELLTDIGFKECIVEDRTKCYSFDGLQHVKSE